MSSKEIIEKAFVNVTKEVSDPNIWNWIQPLRGLKYYYLRLVRFYIR